MKALRLLQWLAGGTVLLCLLLAGAAVWLLYSPAFAAWAASTVQSQTAGRVRLSGVSGTLAEELDFQRVEVDVGESRVVAQNVRLRVDLSSILARALVVDFVHANDVTYTYVPDEGSEPPGEMSVPILVRVDEVVVTAARLVMPDREWLATDTRFALRLQDRQIELTRVRSTFDAFAIEGDSTLNWAGALALEVSACATGSYRDEAIAACIDANGEFPDLAVDAVIRSPFPASATGRVRLADDYEIDVEAQWTDASLRVQPDWRSPSGRMRLYGPLAALRATGDGTAAYTDETFDFSLDVRNAGEQIEILSARVGIAGMAAVAMGRVAVDMRSASVVLSATDVDPEHWLAGWPGDLDGGAQIALDLRDGLAATVDGLTVTGELRGYPISATGALTYANGTVVTDGLNIVSRADSISLTGAIGEAIDANVSGEINDLAVLVPGAIGRVQANVHVLGALDAPRFTVEMGLSDAGFAEMTVARLDVTGDVGLSPADAFSLQARASGVHAGAVGVDTATVETQGTIGAHSIGFVALAEDWRLDGAAEGGWDEDSWRGTLNELGIDPRVLDRWELAAPSSLVISDQRIQLPEACLAHAESQICATIDRQGSATDFVQVRAARFDIDLLTPLFPSGFAAGGQVDIDLKVENSATGPRGEGRLTGSAAQFSVELADGVMLDFPVETLQLGASIDQARMRLAASFGSAAIGQAVVNLDVADVRLDDSPVSGLVSVSWTDTSALELLSPDVENISGPVDAEITLGGTLASPTLAGEARWTSGTVEVPAWGLLVESIDGRATASGDELVRFTANGLVNGAAVEVEGSTLLDSSQSWPTELRLRGEDLLIVQLQDAEIYVSPDLTAEVMLPEIRIAGSVQVPRARIEIVELPAQAVAPSVDTVVHGREQVEAPHPLDVRAQLELVLGDDVRYNGGNVSAKVTGGLSLDYQSERRAAAVGAVTLTGEYDAYGTPLDLERGQLVFAGPFDNPALDIRAVRRIEETTVGVQLVGTLKAPESTIFSDPVMSEADALSYLIFGRPLEDAVGSETNAIQSAALSMGLRQALPAIERIGTSLGLDDLTIRSTNTDAGALMAGKYLAPNLYLRYSYGLFNRIGGLLLRYRISDRLSLETQSGEQKSMDLLYTVEKE